MKEFFTISAVMIAAVLMFAVMIYIGVWAVFLVNTKLPWPPPYRCFW